MTMSKEMEIVYRNPKILRGYERNARTHSDDQIDQIAASIREFGFNNPILIDDTDTIVAGHGRLAAALKIELYTVPCIVLSHLTDAQRRAYILADNKLALNAGWDAKLLSMELADIAALGVEVSLVGWDEKELAQLLPLLPGDGLTDPDAMPSLPDEPVSKHGDVWILGEHRLLCGDSTESQSWKTILGEDRLEAVWTDPPYNVNYGDKAEALSKRDKGHRNVSKIINDNLPSEQFRIFLAKVYAALFSNSRPGCPVYVAHSETERASFTAEFIAAGFKLASAIIWKKSQLVLGRSDYHFIHEPMLYGWKPGAAHPWFGGRKNVTVQEFAGANGIESAGDRGGYMFQVGDSMVVVRDGAMLEVYPTTVMSEPKPQRSVEHPTMKPVALVERCLINSARPGAIVGDAFGGSGTTLIAAERLGMRARLIEMSPRYCDVIVNRWQEYTGREAELVG